MKSTFSTHPLHQYPLTPPLDPQSTPRQDFFLHSANILTVRLTHAYLNSLNARSSKKLPTKPYERIVMKESLLIPILNLREVPVLIDADLAKIYGVPTKRLNEQVKRNSERFPQDFCFQLTAEEKAKVVANCDHLKAIEAKSGNKISTSTNFKQLTDSKKPITRKKS